MKVFNQSRTLVIATHAKVADTFLKRMVGLLNRTEIHESEALIISHCKSIHMLFMHFPIDVLFLDRKNCVVGIVQNIKPFCLSKIFFKADYAIELKAGVIQKTGTALGDIIELLA